MVHDFWLKNKHTISIFQVQVRDLAKHIEAQPKKHNAYKKERVLHDQITFYINALKNDLLLYYLCFHVPLVSSI